MTEEEAKTKWCPYRWAPPEGATVTCIGSACMAWRWNGIPYTDNQTGETSFLNGQPTHGHCGLAGSLYR